MDSWTGTWRLVAVAAVVAISYPAGRWVAEMLETLAAGGGWPAG